MKQDTFQFKTKQPGAQPSRLSSRQILVSQPNRFGSSRNALPREGMSVAWWDKNGYVPINFWNNKSINKPLLLVSDLQVPQNVLLLMPVKFYKSHQLFPFPPFFSKIEIKWWKLKYFLHFSQISEENVWLYDSMMFLDQVVVDLPLGPWGNKNPPARDLPLPPPALPLPRNLA